MAKKKKKKVSAEERHRVLQDQVAALPYAIEQMKAEGKGIRAFFLRYLTGPLLRFMLGMMNRSRYKGPQGTKLKQSEQMKRHLEQRRKAMQYYQGEMDKVQKKQQKRAKR
jgi:hypothetical protein